MSEKFTKSWRGWVKSSDGYAIRMLGRTGIDYRDDRGQIRIDAEAMSSPWNEVVVYKRSLPDSPERPQSEVLARLQRAFEFRGWRITLDDGEHE